MSNDNKTLADVLPGGRVRLGDQPPFVFARFVNGVRMAEGVTIEKERNLTDAMQVAAKVASKGPNGETPVLVHVAALSAQPSPGGQGMRAREFLAASLASAGRKKGAEAVLAGDLYADTRIALRAIEAALAARQPVGEPVAFAVESKALEAHAASRKLNLCQHPLHYLFLDPVTYEARQAWKAALVFAPPAQSVDLPYSLDADPAGIRARVCDVITGTLMIGAQGHTPPPAGHWAEPFWQAARADATAQAVDLGRWSQRHADDLHVAVHTALSVHAGSLSQKKRAAISAYVKRLLIDSQAEVQS